MEERKAEQMIVQYAMQCGKRIIMHGKCQRTSSVSKAQDRLARAYSHRRLRAERKDKKAVMEADHQWDWAFFIDLIRAKLRWMLAFYDGPEPALSADSRKEIVEGIREAIALCDHIDEDDRSDDDVLADRDIHALFALMADHLRQWWD